MRMNARSHDWLCLWKLLVIFAFCFSGCKDEERSAEAAYDPSKPIVVSDFTPKEGGVGSRLVIYGDNFGNDASRVKVLIGGQQAKVIGLKNNSLYCFVPPKAYSGDIEITIMDENNEELSYSKCESNFTYKKKMLVSTFIGQMYENNTKYDIKDGPFDDCGGLEKMEWMTFDPNDHNKLYICGGGKSHRVVDFENKQLKTIKFSGDAASGTMNCFSFTQSGDLIVVKDVSSDNSYGLFVYSKESGFTDLKASLKNVRGCRAAVSHPVNGEIYISRYPDGWMSTINPETFGMIPGTVKSGYGSSEMFAVVHPTGNYMYIMMRNKHMILRSDYDWEKKSFGTPYLACGKNGTSGFQDGVGNSVRMYEPQQGVFVKNPVYAGNEDEYDFYFCDKKNHCIRCLTPLGYVSTFAGRPNNDGTNGFNDGDLRTEARFNYPAGIAYDDQRNCFFVGDSDNHRIRKIALEE